MKVIIDIIAVVSTEQDYVALVGKVAENDTVAVMPKLNTSITVSNLCKLSTEALKKAFPNLDPFQVAKIYADHEQIALSQSKVSRKLSRLSELCTHILSIVHPGVNLEDLIKAWKSTGPKQLMSSEGTVNINFEEYLRMLALKRVSVTVSKLDPDIIKLWTKTHWQFEDPYSGLEEIYNTSSVCDSIEENMVGKTFQHVGGHVLRHRKCGYNINRNRRTSTNRVFYRNMCEDTPSKKRSLSVSTKGLSAPSKNRLRS